MREAVAADAAPRQRPAGWLGRLAPEQLAEIMDIKAAWVAGDLHASGHSLARSLVANCRARGIPICGVDGVRAWLAKPD